MKKKPVRYFPYKFWLTKADKAIIVKNAKKNGINQSEVIRNIIKAYL